MNTIEQGLGHLPEITPELKNVFKQLDFKVGRISNFENAATNFYNSEQREQRERFRGDMLATIDYFSDRLESIEAVLPTLASLDARGMAQVIAIEETCIELLHEVINKANAILVMMDQVLHPMVDTDIIDLTTEISSQGEELTFFVQDHLVPVTRRMAAQPLYQAYRAGVNELDRMPETAGQQPHDVEQIAAK